MAGNKNAKSISKYLANYAEAEVGLLQGLPDCCFQHVVLIPVYRESQEFVSRFVRQFSHKKVLLILVVNQPDEDNDHTPQQCFWQKISTLGDTQWQSANLKLQAVPQSEVQILMVDRFSEELRIPKKQGVGLARKIAADIACALIQENRLNDSQIYSTDADTELPNDFFQNSCLQDKSTAGVFRFRHTSCGDPTIDVATQLYEKRLHYYVQGLKYAGSPYAFHTIGSCLCFDMLAYCQARGFPKKSGGEDFYLLNKLAKTGVVEELEPTIRIRSRVSNRVPFGTGPAVVDIIEQQQQEDSYHVYHPQIFVRLKNLMDLFPKLCSQEICSEEFSAKLEPATLEFLNASNFFKHYQKWQEQYQGEGLVLTFTHWFDAFKTLKYVHFQRVHGLSDINLQEAMVNSKNLWQ